MNRAQALARLRKLLGPKAAIDQRRRSSPEQREAERLAYRAAQNHKNDCYASMDARSKALLAADAEYQRMRGEYEAAVKKLRTMPAGLGYEWTAGTHSHLSGIGGIFHVSAQADSLAELVEKVEQSRKAAA